MQRLRYGPQMKGQNAMKYGMKLKTVLLLIMMLVSGCANNGSAGNSCAGFKPIMLDGASIDGLTDRDAQAVLTHNTFGRAVGCW